jgi:hypothetical protein
VLGIRQTARSPMSKYVSVAVQINDAELYCERSFSPGVPLTVAPDALNVT